MKPTVEWMKEKYIQFNNQIFNNYLEMFFKAVANIKNK